MPPASGLSEYELQRLKNLEENRKILESIRQEQAKAFGVPLPPPTVPKKKKGDKRPSENKPKKKPVARAESGEEGSSNENQAPEPQTSDSQPRRRSSRLCGKKQKVSWRNAADDGDDNSGDEDFKGNESDASYSDDDDEDDGEYERPKRGKGKTKGKRPPGPQGPRQKIVIPKNRPNFYGAVPGVEVGKIWDSRLGSCADGIHRPTVAGIHAGPEGAYSISLAGGYEDDVDLGDCFTYTGEGGRELKGTKNNPKNLRTAPQSKDQTLTRGNLALSLNITTRKPVRVIRGAKLNNEFAPDYGYRYDGLYTVEKYWSCVGKAGYKVYKFALNRCPDQAPPPWVTGPLPQPAPKPEGEQEDELMDEDEDDDDETKPKQPTVLRVKLFNK